jgi:hypothetical protein
MRLLPAVQQVYTRYAAIADDTLYLADRRPRAIFELHPPNLSLSDDDLLESTAQQLAGVLSSLPFPFQLLFRFVAVDLEDHAAQSEHVSSSRGPELAAGGRDYAALLRHLSRTLVLLELRVFLIVGLEGAHGSFLRAALSLLSGLLPRGLQRHRRAGGTGSTDTDLLDVRGAKVAGAFHAIGASPRRLENAEIAELLYTCWCPERARRQPLQIRPRAA